MNLSRMCPAGMVQAFVHTSRFFTHSVNRLRKSVVLLRNVYDQPTLLDLREDRLWACQTEREWPLNLRVKPTDIVIHPLEPIIAYRSLDQLCLYSLQYQEHLYIGPAK